MSQFAIAGLQLAVSPAGGNIPLVKAAIAHVANVFPWVQMIMLSELAVQGPAVALAEPMPGPSERALQAIAKEHELWLVSGSMYEIADDQTFNTCSVINPEGRVVTRYRKMFPFRPYSIGVDAGTEFVVFDVPEVGRFGLSICYDIWFPEHARTLACMGADVILHPVMTATVDREVELAITRATAATNQCFVFSVNAAGVVGVGRSTVIGPDGDVIHQSGAGHEIIPIRLDLGRVRQSREEGLLGLGQPLKSFRDAPVTFEVYEEDSELRAHLDVLGPVEKPPRGD